MGQRRLRAAFSLHAALDARRAPPPRSRTGCAPTRESPSGCPAGRVATPLTSSLSCLRAALSPCSILLYERTLCATFFALPARAGTLLAHRVRTRTTRTSPARCPGGRVTTPLAAILPPRRLDLIDARLRREQPAATGKRHGKARHVAITARLHRHRADQRMKRLAPERCCAQQTHQLTTVGSIAVADEIVAEHITQPASVHLLGGTRGGLDTLAYPTFVGGAVASSNHRENQAAKQHAHEHFSYRWHPKISLRRGLLLYARVCSNAASLVCPTRAIVIHGPLHTGALDPT